MWFCKKAPKPVEYKECVGCGCLMRRARKTVVVEHHSPLVDYNERIELYCGVCALPYDVKHYDGVNWRYYRKEPARNVEITEKGKVVMEKGA